MNPLSKNYVSEYPVNEPLIDITQAFRNWIKLLKEGEDHGIIRDPDDKGPAGRPLQSDGVL